MSPGACAEPGESAPTVTAGGRRSGRERKCCTSLGFAGGGGGGGVSSERLTESNSATVNLQANGVVEAPRRSKAWTVTTSPSENGLVARKLAPSPRSEEHTSELQS